ncbi:LacI family DNA-binding transcriptional regulator [Herbiconiux sp. KACC 21604]|uniref:LacI family DNA-binding transcriptional regulator n=1 Tax=unclassified Herbiconiux TaxID=2618217 RepID=UPI0014914208|nr:LacI family DNA-binding transcriptional regulator [Herbiconiux sp. SALV-R1]QJU55503.1 LacI family DNA-binding transcriptional regulator [Herbiconiux sp. SALV-R1]WPO86688.1 LacI family DNA-binding transcriptional regulator [Herbiconiux sp. KACC 21604]
MSSSEQPRVTLSLVADRAGVSVSTASLAFSGAGPVSDATRDRVLAAARELGYSGPDPRARSLRQGRSGVVGIVFDESLLNAFRDPVNVSTLDGIATGLGTDSNGLLLMTESGAVEGGIREAAVDAAVIMGCSPVFGSVIPALQARGVPVVTIEGGAQSFAAGVTDIGLDNADAAETLARHLAELGHRRVAIITLGTDEHRETGPLTPERRRGMTTAVAADRLEGVLRVFPDAPAWSAGHNLVEEGALAARALLEGPEGERPTAVLAQSDLLAVGVLQAARDLGLEVPRDLSVTGFDGVRIDGLGDRDLTTMRQPVAEKGRAAGAAVVELLAGRPAASGVFVCTFHEGATTAPPPGGAATLAPSDATAPTAAAAPPPATDTVRGATS